MNLNDLALPAGLIAFGVLAFIALLLIAAHQLTERRRHDSDEDGPWPPETPPTYPAPEHPEGSPAP